MSKCLQEDSDASVTMSGGEDDDDVSMDEADELDEGAAAFWVLTCSARSVPVVYSERSLIKRCLKKVSSSLSEFLR
jgi:hypothetical protein